jgi:hypothetical protein
MGSRLRLYLVVCAGLLVWAAACCPVVWRPLDDLAERASRDLKCPANQLTLTPGRSPAERLVSGCGREKIYVMVCNGECEYR